MPEKLELMEQLWQELRRDEEGMDVTERQKELLDSRERQIEDGTAKIIDWEEAKARIIRKVT